MKNNCYVDFHVIQTVPPSCVNRDDTGSPKIATYGGVIRARVSSQAWKHAMRMMFEDLFSPEFLGKRTKKIHELLISRITEAKPELADKPYKLANAIVELFKAVGITLKVKEDKKEGTIIIEGTGALVFMSYRQAEELTNIYLKSIEEKKEIGEYKDELAKAIEDHPSVDIALFGRMVASNPSLKHDAAAQVAHAISTHEVQTEYDYFTALDDLAPEDNAGAAHLDTNEFNSSTLYRFASINVNELANHLKEDTPEAVKNFACAFISSMPEGKQKSYGNRTPQDFVYIAIRDDQPVNLCGAFEKAVPASSEGYVIPSIHRLDEYANKVYDDFVNKPEKSYAVGNDDVFKDDAQHIHLKEVFDSLKNDIEEYQKQV